MKHHFNSLKFYFKSYLILSIFLVFQNSFSQQTDFENLQKILKDYNNVRDFTIAKEGNEAYFTIQSPLTEISKILKIEKHAGKWGEPRMMEFSDRFKDLEPFLTENGLRLYFSSNRPLNPKDSVPKDFDIWYVERNDLKNPWSNPINLDYPVNTEYDEFYPSVSNNLNIYYTTVHPSGLGKDDIFFSVWKNQKYSEPKSLPRSINSAGYEFNAFIAPDETYLIFTGYNRDDGYGSGDLYISFNEGENSWSEAVNLGTEYNSEQMDYCPFVGQSFLFFTSRRSLPAHLDSINNLNDLQNILSGYQNGLSRIYALPFSPASFKK